MTIKFRSGKTKALRSQKRSKGQSRLRPSDRPTLQIEPLEARQLLAGDTIPNPLDVTDLSPIVANAFARASDLAQYSHEDLRNTNSWTAHLTPGHDVNDIAQLLQIDVSGLRVPDYISNTVIFDQAGQPGAGTIATGVNIASVLASSDVVDFFYPLVPMDVSTFAAPNDPLFPEQWHLFNYGQSGGTQGVDGNVVSVWDDFTGDGVVIGILDDAVQGAHPDLAPNYRSDLSFDFVGNDSDASPESTFESHGTAVAGVAAAAWNNNIGGAGVAPEADIAGIRLLGGLTDETAAGAFGHMTQSIDIYNSSWGQPDGSGLEERIGPLSLAAFADGVTDGRAGLGSVHVFAVGNGGQLNDWANWGEYAGNRFTLGVAGVDQRGRAPIYAEPGSNILISAPTGSGRFGSEGITTTDLIGAEGYNTTVGESDGDAQPDLDYTRNFDGTSSAAPYVSGVIALMLEANASLSYRDIQHILVRTSQLNDSTNPNWTTNGAGRDVNYLYGFGAVDAQSAVDLARVWNTVQPLQTVSSGELVTAAVTIEDFDFVGETITFPVASNAASAGFQLEHVEVTVDITHEVSGDLEIVLISPSGTQSILSNPNGEDIGDFANFTFTTVRHWDEGIAGDWSVRVRDVVTREPAEANGTVDSLQVNFYGSQGSPTNLESVANDDGTISGTVFFDANGNEIQGTDEQGLANRLIYLDQNRNGDFDEGEMSTTTSANGFYLFTGLEPGDYRVIDYTGDTSIPPTTSSIDVTLSVSEDEFNVDFASSSAETGGGPTGSITGSVYNDLNQNGIRDAGEPGVAGMVAYVDTNNNCIIGLGEPGVRTDSDGNFTITDMEPGTHNIRLAPGAGQLHDLPCNGFQVFVAQNGRATSSPAFAVMASDDTSGGSGGSGGAGDVTHGEVPGFLLGNAINVDDGVIFLSGLQPGMTEIVSVDASQLSVSPGFLQAWIDFNGDGDWDDPGEQILRNQTLIDGQNQIPFQVPAGATAQMANARFRWALERDLGPFDPALAGETEDYVVSIPMAGMTGLTATDDEATVDEDSVAVVIDVLANDLAGPFSDNFSLTRVDMVGSQGGTAMIVDGMLVYTPKADFVGTEKFTYTVTDDLGGESTGTLCITVRNVNDAPMAVDDVRSASMGDTGISIDVLTNDFDIDGDTLEIISVGMPSRGGTVVISGSELFYSPAADFIGTETFTYTIQDPSGETSTATVTVNLLESTTLVGYRLEAVDLLGNSIDMVQVGQQFILRGYVDDLRDGDPETDPLGVFSAYLDAVYDTNLVSVVGSGISDGGGIYTTARAGSLITPGLIDEVGGLAGTTEELTDPTGNSELILFEVTMQANETGRAEFTGNPADIIPIHETSLFGQDTPVPNSKITFQSDALNIVNNGLTAIDDSVFVPRNSTDNVFTVLDNDSDNGSNANLTIIGIESGPTSGTATISADGRTILYTPNADYSGADSLTYRVSDGFGEEATATVSIVVNDFLVDYVLQATDLDGNVITEIMAGQQFTLQVFVQDLRTDGAGVFSAFSDVTYPSANVAIDSLLMFSAGFPVRNTGGIDSPGLIDEAGGIADGTGPGPGNDLQLLYTVMFTALAEGNVTFRSDPADFLPINETTLYGLDAAVENQDIRFGTAMINVLSSGGQADMATVLEDSATNPIDVLGNDMVLGTRPLEITGVRGASTVGGNVITTNGGTVTHDGQFVYYTPAPNFSGTDSFTYQSRDQDGNTSGATVIVTVTNVNDDPTANDDSLAVLTNSMNNSLAVLSNDSTAPDPANTDNLTISAVGATSSGGTVTISADGQMLIYTPATNFEGVEAFTYTLSDGNGGSSQATVNVTVDDMLPALSGFEFTVTNEAGGGTVLDEVSVGESFFVNVFVNDLRNDPIGTFSAFLDVFWTGGGDVTMNGNFQYGPLYPNFQRGTFDGNADMIDELGAVDGIDFDAHTSRELLVSIPLTASAAGALTFTGDAAEDVRNVTTLFGESAAVPPNRQSFDIATVQVSGVARIGVSQNTSNHFDVDGDSLITPVDALNIINALNDPIFAAATTFRAGSGGSSRPQLMLDVSGDSFLSPVDALLVINELNRITTTTTAAPTIPFIPVTGVGSDVGSDGDVRPILPGVDVNGPDYGLIVDSAIGSDLQTGSNQISDLFVATTRDDDDSEESQVDASFADWFLFSDN